MTTFVKVKFNSAKLVYVPSFTKKDGTISHSTTEKVHDPVKGYMDRPNYFDNTEKVILFEPISNMLHVLFGERPSSTFRKCNTKRNPRIDEIVRNGYIKINTAYQYEDNNGKKHICTETTQGKKNAFNSHSISFYTKVGDEYVEGECTWKILYEKFYFDNREKYYDIMKHLCEFSGINNPQDNYTLADILLLIGNSKKKDNAINYFKSIGLAPLNNVIDSEKKTDIRDLTKIYSKKAARLINHCIVNKLTLDGEFIFKVTDEEFEELYKRNRFAKYLDGGVAELIPERLYLDENDLYEYEPISKYEC